jgi:hypothetical protein
MSPADPTQKFLFLFRGSEWDRALSPAQLQETMAAFLAWFTRLQAEGTLLAGHPLLDEARLVSREGAATLPARPAVAVAGYFLIQAAGFEAALAIAQQCPTLAHGASIEVRPVATECASLQKARSTSSSPL